jgi:hypothetical protein
VRFLSRAMHPPEATTHADTGGDRVRVRDGGRVRDGAESETEAEAETEAESEPEAGSEAGGRIRGRGRATSRDRRSAFQGRARPSTNGRRDPRASSTFEPTRHQHHASTVAHRPPRALPGQVRTVVELSRAHGARARPRARTRPRTRPRSPTRPRSRTRTRTRARARARSRPRAPTRTPTRPRPRPPASGPRPPDHRGNNGSISNRRASRLSVSSAGVHDWSASRRNEPSNAAGARVPQSSGDSMEKNSSPWSSR